MRKRHPLKTLWLTSPLAIAAAFLGLATTGCNHSTTTTTAMQPASTRGGFSTSQQTDAADYLNESMAESIAAASPRGERPSRVLVEFGQARNQTGASNERFQQFVDNLEVLLRRTGTRYGIEYTDRADYALHLAALPMADNAMPNQWLVQLQLVGPDFRDGSRRVLWSDTAAFDAP